MRFNVIVAAIAMWAAMGSAQAVTLQLHGTFSLWSYPSASSQLNGLVGTSFISLLTYDENASPTSVWAPYFTNYANQGSISISTLVGSTSGNFSNLQTFIYETIGTNFNGYVSSQNILPQLTIDNYNVTSIDFEFASYQNSAGLSSFDLPSSIALDDFNNGHFVRLQLSNGIESNALIGGINQVSIVPPSTVPAPPAFILVLTGLGVLSLAKRLSKKPDAVVRLPSVAA